MVDIVFELHPGEKLDYTFNFTPDMDAISATIEGTPTIAISPSSPALTLVSGPTLDATSKKVSIVVQPTEATELEYAITCIANATGSPDRNFKQGITIRIKDTPPQATGGLTTTARVISEFGITDAAQQSLVADQILEATAMIESDRNRTFGLQEDLVESVASTGGFVLMLQQTPILAITSILFDGAAVASSEYSIQDAQAGLVYSRCRWNDTGSYGQGIAQEIYPNSEEKLYTVTYDAGYVLPGKAGRTLPRDIERACIELVRHLRNLNSRGDATIKTEAVPGVYSVEYFDGAAGGASLPDHVAKMLAPYRRVMI